MSEAIPYKKEVRVLLKHKNLAPSCSLLILEVLKSCLKNPILKEPWPGRTRLAKETKYTGKKKLCWHKLVGLLGVCSTIGTLVKLSHNFSAVS